MADATFQAEQSAGDSIVVGVALTSIAEGYLYNNTTFDRHRSVIGDAQAAIGIGAFAGMLYNGTTYDRPRSVPALDAAPNVDTGILAAGIGPGWDRKQNPANLAVAANSAITVVTDGAAVVSFAIGTTTTGTIIFEQSADDAAWVTATNVIKLNTDAVVTGSQTPTSGDIYMVRTSGWRQVRVRVATLLGATVAVKWTGAYAAPRLMVDVITQPAGGSAFSVVDAAAWTTAVSSFVPTGGVFNDTATALTSGQQGTARLTSDRRLHVAAAGDIANAAADSGNPVKIGGRAQATLPTAVTAGQRTNAWLGLSGQLMVGGLAATPTDTQPNSVQLPVDSAGNPQATMVYTSAFNGTTWDRLRLITALDAAPNADTGVLAIGDGPGWDRKQNPAGVAATSTANAVTIETDGADIIVMTVATIGVTPGSMIIESSGDDGTTWATAGSVIKLGAETWVSGAFVPAVGDSYMVRTTGLRRVRYRVNAVYTSGTATIKWTGSTGVGIIKAMDLAPQPHNIGQAILNYQSASLGVGASVLAIALTSGKRVYITAIRVSEGGTVTGSIAIYSGAGAFTEGTSPTAFFSEFAPSATSKPGAIMTFPVPWSSANAGEDIRITTLGLTASHVMIQYYIA